MFRYHRRMREARVEGAAGKVAQEIVVAGHRLRSDETIDKGGDDSGPAPHELLLGALGACTAMTLKIYAERKAWPLRTVGVTVSGERRDGRLHINRRIDLSGDLDAEQRQRLIEIADKCPVHRTLSAGATIRTTEGAA